LAEQTLLPVLVLVLQAWLPAAVLLLRFSISWHDIIVKLLLGAIAVRFCAPVPDLFLTLQQGHLLQKLCAGFDFAGAALSHV
jgi:hypothetical protein